MLRIAAPVTSVTTAGTAGLSRGVVSASGGAGAVSAIKRVDAVDGSAETTASDDTVDATVSATTGNETAAPNIALTAPVPASIGFATQSLAQETIGAGLHIEPWGQALSAYRHADIGSGDVGGLLQSLTV